jgi:hypothetical protein
MYSPPRRRTRTFRSTLVRTLAANFAAIAAVLLAWSLTSGLASAVVAGEPFQEPGLDRVTHLIEKHDCWSGEAPENAPIPGHAVVTLPGGRPRVMSADVGFGIWLYHEPGVVHAFCP